MPRGVRVLWRGRRGRRHRERLRRRLERERAGRLRRRRRGRSSPARVIGVSDYGCWVTWNLDSSRPATVQDTVALLSSSLLLVPPPPLPPLLLREVLGSGLPAAGGLLRPRRDLAMCPSRGARSSTHSRVVAAAGHPSQS